MRQKIEFSPNELKIIKHVSSLWYRTIEKCQQDGVFLNEISVLESVAFDVFIEGKSGHYVNALRRALKAFKRDRIWRGTPEYEKLISVDTEETDANGTPYANMTHDC